MKCPICGAENPEGKDWCGDCGTRLPEPASHESISPMAQKPEALKARWSAAPTKTRKLIVLAIAIMVVILAISVALAYYYEPVRGDGSIWPSSVSVGGSVAFRFTPTQGVGPFTYAWSFGDGTTSSQNAGDHTYNSLGTHTISVVVTDRAGEKCTWTTKITVRTALTFIESVSYPASYSAPMGDTEISLFVDGVSTPSTRGVQQGIDHTVHLKITWVVDFGVGQPMTSTVVDDTGTLAFQKTQTDFHCVLHYSPSGTPKFSLAAT